MYNPKVSIILTSYNYAHLIEKTINSIIQQTYKNWELIIIDDGSKDNSIEVIEKYTTVNDNIKLFTHDNNMNKGLIESVLLGVEKTTADYIAFLESDDYWEINYLKEKINVLEKNQDVKFIYNNVNIIGDVDAVKTMDIWKKSHKDITDNLKFPCNIAPYFFMMTLVPTFSCVFLKKEVLLNCNFNSPVAVWLDWLLWTQISVNNEFYYIDKKLTNWYKHKTSYINNFKKNKKADYLFYNERLKYLKNLKMNPLKLTVLKIINYPFIEKLFRPTIRTINKYIIKSKNQ